MAYYINSLVSRCHIIRARGFVLRSGIFKEKKLQHPLIEFQYGGSLRGRDVSYYPVPGLELAPVAQTGFSHRLTVYKIVRHFFGLSFLNISGTNQVENISLKISYISVPCPHAQLRGRTVIKMLWTFLWPWGRDRSQSLPCWIFHLKQIH